LRDSQGKALEYFYHEYVPRERDSEATSAADASGGAQAPEEIKSQLF
jgi:hypothetical protein